MASVSKPVYSVQVRELVQFVLRSGDLGGVGDFVGSDRALAGTRGHQRIQRARPSGYQKEVSVSHEIVTEELTLRIQGRIDGLLVTEAEVLLEEIKTIRGGWDRVADPLHWAQARCYGFIYAHDHGLEKLSLQLTYLDLDTGALTEFRESQSFRDLAGFFEETAAVYLEWIQERHRWCEQRDQSIKSLPFPFPRYRPGQRELAVAVYQALGRGGRLFIEAPTGIGKTISALFPALKALPEGKLDQLFYLTARTVGRTVAEKAFADLRAAGARVRTLTLTAREKLCVREGHPSDATTSPLAIGYYDRCKPAMRDALNREVITRFTLEAVSRKHQVCPFELSLDVSLWVDAIVCDYNYVFHPQVYLRRHFAEPARDYGFLVDEAHNLVDRAREMFSADLRSGEIDEVRRALQKTVPRCAQVLGRLSTAIRKLSRPSAPRTRMAEEVEASEELDLFPGERAGPGLRAGPEQNAEPLEFTEKRGGALTARALPPHLLPLVEHAIKEAETWLARNQAAHFRESLLQLYFRLQTFRRTAELYDDRYVTIVEPGESLRVLLFCLDPSARLRHALERGRAAIFFSGTLTPLDYYRALLGGEPEDRLLQFPSPFPPEHLAVLVHDRIRTDFKARAETLAEVVRAIGALVEGRRGNYLIYLPSYQYLKTVREQFRAVHPDIVILEQHSGMTEPEREVFLAAFASEHAETLVGFAVLGGIFGEGIDLVGERLIGVVVVGVGLPQLCAERDLIRDYFQERIGSGFDYAYSFPGMNRVLQGVGRVIRSETDRGVVLLIDTRFGEQRYRRLFPDWWQPVPVRTVADIRMAVQAFWPRSAEDPPLPGRKSV